MMLLFRAKPAWLAHDMRRSVCLWHLNPVTHHASRRSTTTHTATWQHFRSFSGLARPGARSSQDLRSRSMLQRGGYHHAAMLQRRAYGSSQLLGVPSLCACTQCECGTFQHVHLFHPKNLAQARACKPVVWSQLWTGHATESVNAP